MDLKRKPSFVHFKVSCLASGSGAGITHTAHWVTVRLLQLLKIAAERWKMSFILQVEHPQPSLGTPGRLWLCPVPALTPGRELSPASPAVCRLLPAKSGSEWGSMSEMEYIDVCSEYVAGSISWCEASDDFSRAFPQARSWHILTFPPKDPSVTALNANQVCVQPATPILQPFQDPP